MDETVKIGLFLSSLLNILFFGLGSVFVAKRGGLQYLIRQIYLFKNAGFRITAMYDNPFYRDKTSHFDTLPQSDSEIIFLGDSLTDLCEWAEFFKNERIKNRGICGDTTDGVLNRLPNIVESRPQKLFMMIGINDLSQGREVLKILNNYKIIFKSLQEQTPKTKVFIQSLLPVNTVNCPNRKPETNEKVIEINAALKEFAKEFSFQYIDLHSSFLDRNNELDAQYTSDGVHLNGQGYLIWKGIIEKDVVD
jgi:lysophospholipase L1-like esterase